MLIAQFNDSMRTTNSRLLGHKSYSVWFYLGLISTPLYDGFGGNAVV